MSARGPAAASLPLCDAKIRRETDMSELDPTAASRALDSILSRFQTLPRQGADGPDARLDGLLSKGLVTDPEAKEMRGVLATVHAAKRPSAASVVQQIDGLLTDRADMSPTALAILKAIRYVAEAQATPHANLQSEPPPEFDLPSAADGAVEGGGLGAIAGAEIGAFGGPWGAMAGALIGALVGGAAGGIIKGAGHGG